MRKNFVCLLASVCLALNPSVVSFADEFDLPMETEEKRVVTVNAEPLNVDVLFVPDKSFKGNYTAKYENEYSSEYVDKIAEYLTTNIGVEIGEYDKEYLENAIELSYLDDGNTMQCEYEHYGDSGTTYYKFKMHSRYYLADNPSNTYENYRGKSDIAESVKWKYRDVTDVTIDDKSIKESSISVDFTPLGYVDATVITNNGEEQARIYVNKTKNSNTSEVLNDHGMSLYVEQSELNSRKLNCRHIDLLNEMLKEFNDSGSFDGTLHFKKNLIKYDSVANKYYVEVRHRGKEYYHDVKLYLGTYWFVDNIKVELDSEPIADDILYYNPSFINLYGVRTENNLYITELFDCTGRSGVKFMSSKKLGVYTDSFKKYMYEHGKDYKVGAYSLYPVYYGDTVYLVATMNDETQYIFKLVPFELPTGIEIDNVIDGRKLTDEESNLVMTVIRNYYQENFKSAEISPIIEDISGEAYITVRVSTPHSADSVNKIRVNKLDGEDFELVSASSIKKTYITSDDIAKDDVCVSTIPGEPSPLYPRVEDEPDEPDVTSESCDREDEPDNSSTCPSGKHWYWSENGLPRPACPPTVTTVTEVPAKPVEEPKEEPKVSDSNLPKVSDSNIPKGNEPKESKEPKVPNDRDYPRENDPKDPTVITYIPQGNGGTEELFKKDGSVNGTSREQEEERIRQEMLDNELKAKNMKANTRGAVKTADTRHMILMFAMFMGSAVLFAITILAKKKYEDNIG